MTSADLAVRLFLLLSGPFAGDFVATFAASWPRRPSPVIGRSVCARCGARIPAAAQVPVLSWLLQGGRRTCCDGRIPVVYPLGEAAGLVTGVAAAAATGPGLQLWIYALGLALIYVALVDLRRFSIPVAGLAALAVLGAVAVAAAPDWTGRLTRLATGGALGLLLETLRRLIRRDGRPGLGDGDVLLAICLGVIVDWRLAAPTVVVATLPPLALQLAKQRSAPTPLGFWLNASAGLILLVAQSRLLGG